jgi:ATP phosphoribosyltransferase regulatory subunit
LGRTGQRVASELEQVVSGLPAELQQRTTFDLGEVRGFGYYTGVCFAFLMRGIGEPLARGGRYDNLLAGFGCPEPATGFAIDVELVARSQEGVDRV